MIDMDDEGGPRRTFYVGYESSDDPHCDRHGLMAPFSPVVSREGEVYVPEDTADFRVCPPCCIEAVVEKTGVIAPPDHSVEWLWRDLLSRQWDGHIEVLFSSAGEGEIDDDAFVFLDDPADQLPEFARSDGRFISLTD